MFEFVKDIFRRRALRSLSHDGATGLVSLDGIRTASVIFNVEDAGFNECKDDMQAFFRSRGIRVEFFFFDFRKLEKNELLMTSIQNTILRKDLNWYGMPLREKMELLSRPCDLFVSMTRREDFAGICVCRGVDARFKIGCGSLPGVDFDMVVSGGDDLRQIFSAMQDYLLKIR